MGDLSVSVSVSLTVAVAVAVHVSVSLIVSVSVSQCAESVRNLCSADARDSSSSKINLAKKC